MRPTLVDLESKGSILLWGDVNDRNDATHIGLRVYVAYYTCNERLYLATGDKLSKTTKPKVDDDDDDDAQSFESVD